MATDGDPYAPPAAVPAPGAVQWVRPPLPEGLPAARFTLRGGGAQRAEWSLDVYDDWLRLTAPGAPSLWIDRMDFLARCELVVGTFMRALSIRTPVRVVLPLPPRALSTLRAWLEPVIAQQRAAVLARRFAMGLPIAGVVVVTSLSFGRAHIDVLGLAWGLALGATSLARRFTSRRELFLADCMVWTLLGCTDVARLARHGGAFHAAFALIAAVFAVGAYKLFLFYGPPRPNAR